MKINEITVEDVVEFLHLSEGEFTEKEINAMMAAAKSYLVSYTGLPEESSGETKTINDYDDFWLAYMALCQDMNDNRTFTVDNDKVNPAVKAILDMHSCNLVG